MKKNTAKTEPTTNTTETQDPKKARAYARRAELRELSNKLVQANKEKVNEGVKVNELLVQYYIQKMNATELNTYEQWKVKGFQVRKGSVSFMVWGKPLKEQTKDNGEPANPTAELADFFPVCHLFDASQVAPIQTKAN